MTNPTSPAETSRAAFCTNQPLLNHLNHLIESKPELLTIFAGDSHTWGQGAAGWAGALRPAAVGGEMRRLPENIPSFVRLFGDYLKSRRPAPLETYVINSGYGSTPTPVYLDRYWHQAVEVYRPDIVVLEFAINDWLDGNNVRVDEFGDNLTMMIDKCVAMGAIPILLTVSPILGSQYSGGHYYQDYIDRSRAVAAVRPDVLLADANHLMAAFLRQAGPDGEKKLFEDIWHVGQLGQEHYCAALVGAVEGRQPST